MEVFIAVLNQEFWRNFGCYLFSFSIGTYNIIREFTLDTDLLKDLLTSFFSMSITEFQFVKKKSLENELLLNLLQSYAAAFFL